MVDWTLPEEARAFGEPATEAGGPAGACLYRAKTKPLHKRIAVYGRVHGLNNKNEMHSGAVRQRSLREKRPLDAARNASEVPRYKLHRTRKQYSAAEIIS